MPEGWGLKLLNKRQSGCGGAMKIVKEILYPF